MTSRGGKKLVSNTGALFALQLANYILPFLIIPFLTRTLGVSLYGVVAFGLAMVQIACIITDFGFNLSATRQIASHQTNREFIRKIIGAVHFCKLFLLVPVGALFFFFLYFQDQKYGEYASFFWLLLIPIVGQTFQPIWFYQGIERMGFITLFVVLARSLYLVLTVMWVSGPEDYIWVAVANGVGQVLAALVAVAFLIRLGYAPILPSLTFVKKVFGDSLEFFWSRAAVATYTAGGAFFLGLISTPVAVAHYSAAEQLYKGAQALFQPISQALYPYMTRTKNIPLFFKIMKCAVAISLLGLSFGLLFGDWLLMLFFGQGFSESYSVLVIFMIAFCVTTPSVLMGYPFLGAMGDTRSANLSVMFAGILQIILLAFIWFFGWVEASPVAVSVLLVEIFVMGYRGVKVKALINRIKNF